MIFTTTKISNRCKNKHERNYEMFLKKKNDFDDFKLVLGFKKSGTFWGNALLRLEGGGAAGAVSLSY